MARAPSNDPSLAHDGPSARATPGRGNDAKAPVSVGLNGRKKRVPEMLRLLCRVALAIVTVIVCAIIARPGGGSANLLAVTLAVAPPDSANAEQAPEPSCRRRDGDSRTVVDLKAVEADDDDDDDPLCDVADDAVPAFRCVPPPRQTDPALRGELQIDTSRFAAGTRLPRGPPT